MQRNGSFFMSVVVLLAVAATFGQELQCKNPKGQSVDWFVAIKLPKLKLNVSDGTSYVYMDVETPEWTLFTGITMEKSAIGYTVSQMYAPTDSYNNSIMWAVYNDEPTNHNTQGTLGHSKGMVVANNSSGFWLVHSVPKFPQLPYQNNSYTYPSTAKKFGQSFLCMSMAAKELDKVGDQLINNEVYIYGSHFGSFLKETYPSLYNATLPHGQPSKDHNGVHLQDLQSLKGFKFLSISKNRYFGKDLYEDLLTQLVQSNVYAETWLNAEGRLNSSCTGQYKAINIKSLSMTSIRGLETFSYKSSKDHSKWVVTGNSSAPWTCIGDINRSREQTHRGGGTVCMDSIKIWSQYKKLVSEIEKCKKVVPTF